MHRTAFKRSALLLALTPWPLAVMAAPGCPELQTYLADKATDVVCFHSDEQATIGS